MNKITVMPSQIQQELCKRQTRRPQKRITQQKTITEKSVGSTFCRTEVSDSAALTVGGRAFQVRPTVKCHPNQVSPTKTFHGQKKQVVMTERIVCTKFKLDQNVHRVQIKKRHLLLPYSLSHKYLFLDVSYIVANPCIVFGTTCTCISVKPAKLLALPVTWLPSWISSARRRPTKSAVPPLESVTPKIEG